MLPVLSINFHNCFVKVYNCWNLRILKLFSKFKKECLIVQFCFLSTGTELHVDDLVLQIELNTMHLVAILQLSLFYDDVMD